MTEQELTALATKFSYRVATRAIEPEERMAICAGYLTLKAQLLKARRDYDALWHEGVDMDVDPRKLNHD